MLGRQAHSTSSFRFEWRVALIGFLLFGGLAACGGGGGGGDSGASTPQKFTLGGSISGLTSSGLVLANGSETLTVSANATSFAMPTTLASGSTFSVSVQTQPTGLTCSVTNGSGTMGSANVSNVAVACAPKTFTLGGSITDLTSSGLVLANGNVTFAPSANSTSFTLPGTVAFGSAYSVTVQSQPTGLACNVANGSGTMGLANVSNVAVACVPRTFTLGGSITDLTSSGLVLANGSDTLAVAPNATVFTLPTAVLFENTYNVTVKTQADVQDCSVANGSGTMGGIDISNVTVTCVAANFTVSTFAGSGQEGSDDGNGTLATFTTPVGVATDASGNVYVADADANVIRKITPSGAVSTFAGSGAEGSDDGIGTAASFRAPTSIAIDASGTLFLADRFNNRICKITAGGEVTTLVQGTLDQPTGIAVDVSGNLYVVDQGNQMIRKITPDGTISTLAGSGGRGSADGPGANATFDVPSDVAVDASGNVYVADRNNDKIRKITADGTVSTLAGSGAHSSDDGASAVASFSDPIGIDIDASGRLYVADTSNHKIRVIAPDGTVSTLAGTGASGNTDGSVTDATFNTPLDVAVDGAGNVYVADSENHTIRKIVRN